MHTTGREAQTPSAAPKSAAVNTLKLSKKPQMGEGKQAISHPEVDAGRAVVKSLSARSGPASCLGEQGT